MGWIGQDKAVISTSVLRADDLIRKKAPTGRDMLKLFIRESTSQNSPWIVHANLAKKYGIPTEPPKDMMVTIFPCFLYFLSYYYDPKTSHGYRMVKGCPNRGKD